jgi:integrase
VLETTLTRDSFSTREQCVSEQTGGSLARKRYQKGCVYLDGKKWKGRYREDVITGEGTKRIRREVTLGSKRELPTKRLAERRMEVVLARINGFEYRPTRSATFGEFIERWDVEVLRTQKLSSQRAVRSHLRCYITPELGRLRLDEFGVENQQRFINRMPERAVEKAVSRKTTLNVLATLSSILKTARDWGYSCEPIDVSKLRLPQRDTSYEAPHFSLDQLQRILAIAEDPWRTLYCTLTLTGLRAGEALGLQWGDIDFDRRELHVRRSAWQGEIQSTKSKASETVLPIPGDLLQLLKQYRAQWKENPRGFLFATRNGRPPSSNKVVEYQLWTILDALGIPRCGLHAFRHTHTSLLLDSGASPKVVQRQLRHADARTTLQIYGHVVGDGQREAVEKVASILDATGRQPVTVN